MSLLSSLQFEMCGNNSHIMLKCIIKENLYHKAIDISRYFQYLNPLHVVFSSVAAVVVFDLSRPPTFDAVLKVRL